MAHVWVCTNKDHPIEQHSRYYDALSADGLCPDCDYGTSILVPVEERPEDGGINAGDRKADLR